MLVLGYLCVAGGKVRYHQGSQCFSNMNIPRSTKYLSLLCAVQIVNVGKSKANTNLDAPDMADSTSY